jgi:hypothetical protein
LLIALAAIDVILERVPKVGIAHVETASYRAGKSAGRGNLR